MQWQKTNDGEIEIKNYEFYSQAAVRNESLRTSENPMKRVQIGAARDSDISGITRMSGAIPTSTRYSLSAAVSSRLSTLKPFTAFMRMQTAARTQAEEGPKVVRDTMTRQNLVTSAIGNLVTQLHERSEQTKKHIGRYQGRVNE